MAPESDEEPNSENITDKQQQYTYPSEYMNEASLHLAIEFSKTLHQSLTYHEHLEASMWETLSLGGLFQDREPDSEYYPYTFAAIGSLINRVLVETQFADSANSDDDTEE